MDTHRTDVSELAAVAEHVTPKPTKTRWSILLLISLMYLICYMDRSNISVAQPEIAKQFHLLGGPGSGTVQVILPAAGTYLVWATLTGEIVGGASAPFTQNLEATLQNSAGDYLFNELGSPTFIEVMETPYILQTTTAQTIYTCLGADTIALLAQFDNAYPSDAALFINPTILGYVKLA